MSRTVLKEIFRRLLSAMRFAAWGIGLGMPAGPLAGAAAAGIYGFVAGLVEGDPFTSAGSWLLAAINFWVVTASLYVAVLAGGIGGAIGGASRHRYVGALAGAVAGGGVGLFHGLQGPPGALGVVVILLASGAGAGALAGWVGGRGVSPFSGLPWWW